MESIGLSEVTSIVRTKNAGPFRFTLDIVFKDEAVYRAVKEQQLIGRELMAVAYGVAAETVTVFETFDNVLAIKATFKRAIVAGSPGDPDVYAMNQEAPALAIRLPLDKLPAGVAAETREA